MLIYVTDPAIAASAGLVLGFNNVADALGLVLVNGNNAYTLDYPRALPAFGYVNPNGATFPPPVPSPPPPSPPAPAPTPTAPAPCPPAPAPHP